VDERASMTNFRFEMSRKIFLLSAEKLTFEIQLLPPTHAYT
jgi:hypothetical protein